MLFVLHFGSYCRVVYFSILGYRYERGTAKQGFVFWKYLRLMREPFFLLPPFLGHENSCIYCVTKTQMPIITWQCTSGLTMRTACATGHMCQVLLLDTLCLSTWWHTEENSSLSSVLSAGRYLLFCCCCFMDACLLQAQGLLEERMVRSRLWAWCRVNGQSQASGTWAPLAQGSGNNI